MKTLLSFLVLSSLSSLAWGQTDCSTYNKSDSPQPWSVYGLGLGQGHKSGEHEFGITMGGKCSYTGTTPGQQCAINCQSSSSGNLDSETGTITPVGWHHYTDLADNLGFAQAPNGGSSINCQVTVAAAVRSCFLSCAVTISFSAGANGINATVAFPPDAIFTRSSQLQTTCAPQSLPKTTTGGGCGSGGCCSQPTQCSYDGSGLQCDFCACSCVSITPIIIDTTGHGFHLTSAKDGVAFDFFGKGKPNLTAWTRGDSGNGFLVLDRNGNGKIDDGSELFGDFNGDPNGYLTLAEFDKPEKGGNGDGIIDWHDAVYSKLQIWIDANHDGISQPEELHSLPDMGVYSIGLKYQEETKTDQYGNKFRYRGVLNPNPLDGTSRDGRYTYDVIFSGLPVAPGNTEGCKKKPLPILTAEPLTADPLFERLLQ